MTIKQKLISTLVILLVVWFSIWTFSSFYIAEWVSGTVTEKISKTDSVPNKVLVDIDGKNYVETFINEDMPSRLKFDSGDIQANLKEDEHYRFKVVGVRSYFLSSYRHLIKYEREPK